MTEELPQEQKSEETSEQKPEEEERQETFSREYVEKLRSEAAEHRTRSKRADELQSRLVDALIRETASVLEDPEDLRRNHEAEDFLDEEGYPSGERVREAAEALAKDRPHLARRRPTGDVGQGAREEQQQPASLASILRERAG